MKKTMMFLAAGLLIALPSAYGSSLAPGNTVNGSGDNFSNFFANATLVTSLNGSGANGTLQFSYSTGVYKDNTSGFMDFLIQLNNTGTDAIESITTGPFGTYTTDVGIATGTGASGTVAPTAIDRTLDGNVVKFDFQGSGAILGGQQSDDLIIETNSPYWNWGKVSVQDDVTADVTGFSPVPEPMSMGLLGGGLALLGLVGIRRRKMANL